MQCGRIFLTAAVPYIKQYTDQYVVVKYGGNAMIDEELKKSVMKDLMLLQLVGGKKLCSFMAVVQLLIAH